MKDEEIITDDYKMYYGFDLYLYFGNYLVITTCTRTSSYKQIILDYFISHYETNYLINLNYQ